MSIEDADKEKIFHIAAEIEDAAQRAAYLDKACGAKGELREEVESLLNSDQDADRFLEGSPFDENVT